MSETAKRMRQSYEVTGDKWFLAAAEEIEKMRSDFRAITVLVSGSDNSELADAVVAICEQHAQRSRPGE